MEGDDITFSKKFHNPCWFEKSPNASFITSVPKKSDVQNIRDFWPILFLRWANGEKRKRV